MTSAPAPPDAIVEVRDLVVRFGDTVAVDGASFTIRRGQVCGLIGPNGAGKTTTMRVLATLQRPDSGTARVLGWEVGHGDEWIRWRLGFMPESFQLPDDLAVDPYLRLVAAAHALPEAAAGPAIDAVIELTDLAAHRDKKLGALSKGMRQRLHLARILLPEPELLVLDEPASGLDPRARVELRELIRELQRMGRTILISSHVLADLSETCDALIVLEKGRTVVDGALSDIQARLAPGLGVHVESTTSAAELAAALERHAEIHAVVAGADGVRFRFAGDRRALGELLAALAAGGHRFCTVAIDHDDLEHVFLALTEGVTS